MQIIDSHVHFWEPDRFDYDWLSGSLRRPFLPGDLEAQAGGFMPEKVVFVEAGSTSPSPDEVAWIEELAANAPYIAAIVADAPLEHGEGARATLEAMAGKPLVKGIRRNIQAEAADFLTAPGFVAGVGLLAQYELSFDICCVHHQLPGVIALVSQCPDVWFVLDHIAKPDIAAGTLDPWREHLRQLASYPNVWCKLSGMVTEADHGNWTREQLQPYVAHVVEVFGVERLMFGSDWPVVTLAATYPQWVETLQWALDGLSDTDKQRVFHDNAARFYRLD